MLNKKLVIEKTISNPDCEVIKAGFLYYIQDVGLFWFWDYTVKHKTSKLLEFNFQ